MEWTGSIDWASWLQAFASIAAVVGTPPALTFAGRWLFFRLKFACEATGPNSIGNSQKWRLTIENRSRFARDVKTTVYPPEPGNGVVFAAVRSGNDGGMHVGSAVVGDHVLTISINRLAPRRAVVVDVIFRRPDIPEFETEGARGRRVLVYGPDPTARQAHVMVTAHIRLVMLMLQFIAATILILCRLAWVGVLNQLAT